MKRSLEVAHIFRVHRPAYRDVHGDRLPVRRLWAMRAPLCYAVVPQSLVVMWMNVTITAH